MNFFTRLSNGWDLAMLSLSTIRRQKSLLLFPVFSGTALVLVLSTFFGGASYFGGDRVEALFHDEQYGQIAIYGTAFLYYLINFFIIVFFNAALIHCAIKVLNDEETNVMDGINFSLSRIDKIFGWALLSATVGTLLKALQESGKPGKIIAGLIGITWSVLTFFVVPVLVYENKGVIDSVKRSGRLMREKWGESLAATVSFGAFQFLGFLLAALAGYLLMSINFWLALVVTLVAVLIVVTVTSAAQTVFVAAVYNYATGRPTGDFDSETLDGAFIQK
ncbi:MAG: hypothetical protein KDC70_13980 [Saprospiraceae bacterium]|nr:hypothetical protein [Saprospiraceae bacterium]